MKRIVSRPIKDIALGIYDGPHATPKEAEDGPIFLGISEITPDGRLRTENAKRLSEADFETWTRRVTPQENDIVFTYEATLHRYALIPSDFRACLGRRLGLVRPNPKFVVPKWLHYYMLSAQWRSVVESNVISGATVDRIPIKRFPDFPVDVPPLSLQETAVEILEPYDALIENNRRRMALLEQAARQIYDEWFVRLRFPGHERSKLTESPLGMVPEQWRVVTLGDITTKIGSGATPRGGGAAYHEEGITLIRSLNVYDFRFDTDGLAFITDEQADELSNVTVQENDILLNITGASVCRCCMVPPRLLPARVNQHVMIIRTDTEKADPFYVLCAINSDQRKRQLLSYAQVGSTREALTKTTVSNFQVVLPEPRVLSDFSEQARDIFHQCDILMAQTAKLTQARDLLLPRLMSGEIEV